MIAALIPNGLLEFLAFCVLLFMLAMAWEWIDYHGKKAEAEKKRRKEGK